MNVFPCMNLEKLKVFLWALCEWDATEISIKVLRKERHILLRRYFLHLRYSVNLLIVIKIQELDLFSQCELRKTSWNDD